MQLLSERLQEWHLQEGRRKGTWLGLKRKELNLPCAETKASLLQGFQLLSQARLELMDEQRAFTGHMIAAGSRAGWGLPMGHGTHNHNHQTALQPARAIGCTSTLQCSYYTCLWSWHPKQHCTTPPNSTAITAVLQGCITLTQRIGKFHLA